MFSFFKRKIDYERIASQNVDTWAQAMENIDRFASLASRSGKDDEQRERYRSIWIGMVVDKLKENLQWRSGNEYDFGAMNGELAEKYRNQADVFFRDGDKWGKKVGSLEQSVAQANYLSGCYLLAESLLHEKPAPAAISVEDELTLIIEKTDELIANRSF